MTLQTSDNVKLVHNTLNGFSLYRGPQLDSLELLRKQVPRLKYVISLENGFDFDFLDGKDDIPIGIVGEVYDDKKQILLSKTLLIRWPSSDLFPMSGLLIRHRVLTIQKFLETGSVYVHCVYGKDRTGILCAGYRMLAQGWNYNSALSEMYANGFHKWPYFWWPAFSLKGLDR